MSFDWNRLIDIAELINVTAQDKVASDPHLAEAAWRASISRAYYGVYNRTRNAHIAYWKQDPPRYDDMGVQKALIHTLEQKEPYITDPAVRGHVKKVVVSLKRLVDLRVAADYHDELTEPENKARRAIRYAREIAEHLNGLVRA